MTNSITPPPELVGQWQDESPETQIADHVQHLATRAAQWGADQELEACVNWLDRESWSGESRHLRTARRPQPPSLKELALALINRRIGDGYVQMLSGADADTIRRALQALPND
jgi:hypothetical protein